MFTFAKMHAGPAWAAEPMVEHIGGPTASAQLVDELVLYDIALSSRHSVLEMRPDLDPGIAKLLEIAQGWDRGSGVANLLAGRTAKGNAIPGLVARSAHRSLGEAFGIATRAWPTVEDLERLTSDGDPTRRRDQRRLLSLMGYRQSGLLDADALSMMAAGWRPDGSPINIAQTMSDIWCPRNAPLAAFNAAFAAPKSVSVAVALTGGAMRALLIQAHQDAVIEAMKAVEHYVGCVRRGDGGAICVPATIVWFRTTHFTSRATPAAPGDPHLHDHVVCLCTALGDDGRAGKIDTAALQGMIKLVGAIYQASLASTLRKAGLSVSLHPTQFGMRLDAVPIDLERLFSKRTTGGEDQTREYALSRNIDFRTITAEQRTALVKAGVQGNPIAVRRDDIANLRSWHEQASAIGKSVPMLIEIGRSAAPRDPAAKFDAARTIVRGLLERAAATGKVVGRGAAAVLACAQADLDNPLDIARVAKAAVAYGGANDLKGGRASAENLDLRVVERRSRDGSARLVAGGRIAVLSSSAALWLAEREAHHVVPPVQVATAADVKAVDVATRERMRNAGLLTGGERSVMAKTIGGPAMITLASGDAIVFVGHINGKIGEKHGRVATSGSCATVLRHDDYGLDVMLQKGVEAHVGWRSLYDPDETALSLRHGYATLAPSVIGARGILAMTEGSWRSTRLGIPPQARILFDEDLEIAHARLDGRYDEGAVDHERLWAVIAENLALRGADAELLALERARRRLAALKLSVQARGEHSWKAGRPAAMVKTSRLEPALQSILEIVQKTPLKPEDLAFPSRQLFKRDAAPAAIDGGSHHDLVGAPAPVKAALAAGPTVPPSRSLTPVARPQLLLPELVPPSAEAMTNLARRLSKRAPVANLSAIIERVQALVPGRGHALEALASSRPKIVSAVAEEEPSSITASPVATSAVAKLGPAGIDDLRSVRTAAARMVRRRAYASALPQAENTTSAIAGFADLPEADKGALARRLQRGIKSSRLKAVAGRLEASFLSMGGLIKAILQRAERSTGRLDGLQRGGVATQRDATVVKSPRAEIVQETPRRPMPIVDDEDLESFERLTANSASYRFDRAPISALFARLRAGPLRGRLHKLVVDLEARDQVMRRFLPRQGPDGLTRQGSGKRPSQSRRPLHRTSGWER